MPPPARSSGHDHDVSELIPAATVILARDTEAPGEGFEVLMVRRDSRLAFAGGMWVFPGGRVDAEDFADDPDDIATAEQRAAAREAMEEAGLTVDVASLARWSHWTPPDHDHGHRFSTAFFVAVAPEGEVVVDDGEIRAHQWVTPTAAIARQAAGEIELAPPTYITLVQLAEAGTVEALLALASSREPEHFTTKIATDGEAMVALYHGDAGYEAGDGSTDGPRHRLVMIDGGWRYVRD
jgi:8-oxo-dGTP pyrophosphatase MutT (NUDIX family)